MKKDAFIRWSASHLCLAGVAMVWAMLAIFAYGAEAARAHGNPEIKVEPNPADVGGAVTIEGRGFEGDDEVSLVLEGVLGERSLGAAVTDSEGAFTVTVMLPDTASPGSYRIRAVGSDDVALVDLRLREVEGEPRPPVAHETSVGFHRAGALGEVLGFATLAAVLGLGGAALVWFPRRERWA